MFKSLSLSSLLLLSAYLFGQQHNHASQLDRSNMRDGEDVEYCITHKKIEKIKQDPVLALKYKAAQDQLNIETLAYEQGANLNKAGTIYKVPIVFHVLHNGGIENISRAQVLDALRILNRDFRKLNADATTVVSNFQGMPSDIEIEFVLATKAPNGQCFSGITRTKSPRTVDAEGDAYSGADQVNAVVAGNDVYQGIWPATKYLNVFVCKEIDGAAGYTYNPGIGTSMTYNSIFMLHNYTGSIGTSNDNSSRALTHEVGHWLNLSHTWGGTNSPGCDGTSTDPSSPCFNIDNCDYDDGIADTPQTRGVRTCNLSESSCGPLANVENYMDYSYCSKMFTEGQRSRMRAALISTTSGRNNLWKTSNLTATGANATASLCKADFISDQTIVCAGSPIEFTDASYHAPSGWSWTFQGGIPATSTSQNPTVTYSTPGTYSVSLSATNSNGTVSETKTQYVTVLPTTGIPPLQEGFEFTSNLPTANWFLNNPQELGSFELTNTAAKSGNNSVVVKASNTSEGMISELISSTITLDLNLSATISFDYAFAKKNNANTDKLIVQVSNDCGKTWVTKRSLTNTQLVTAPNTSGNFIPTATEWKTSTINSSSLLGYLNSSFRIKFVFQSGGGNNLYIDNINIDGPVSIEENNLIEEVNLYPNPATKEVNLSFVTLENDENFNITVYDVVGKEIQHIHKGMLLSGTHRFLIDTDSYEAGIYFVSLNNGVRQSLQKLIIK